MGFTNVIDRQTTDGRAIAYSEHEREFTFAENYEFFTHKNTAKHIFAADNCRTHGHNASTSGSASLKIPCAGNRAEWDERII